MEKNIFKDVEGKLYAFNYMKVELSSLLIDLQYLEIEIKRYEEDEERRTEKGKLEEKILKKEKQVKKIENAISILNEKEKRLVEYRYFSNRAIAPSWLDVAEEIGFSDKKCRTMRNEIIEKIKDLV